MQVIKPVPITTITSSNVPEPDIARGEPDYWNDSTVYDVGDEVIYEHDIWRSVDDGVVGIVPGTDPLKWFHVKATNKYSCVDGVITNQCLAPEDENLVFSFEANRITKIGLLNVRGSSVTLTLDVDEDGQWVQMWEQTYSLLENDSRSWWEYFFNPAIFRSDLIADIPRYIDIRLTVTITPLMGQAALGHTVVGNMVWIGETLYGASPSIIDYSRKDVDSQGNYYLKQGRWSKRANIPVHITTMDMDRVFRLMAQVRGKAVLWVGVDEEGLQFDSLIIYGFYREFSPVISGPVKSEYSLEIEGLT